MTESNQKTSSFAVVPYIIIAVFVLFAIFIGQFVYRSTKIKQNLVSKDYYQQELEYEKRMAHEQNTQSIKDQIDIACDLNRLTITFPQNWKNVTGNVYLYNMANKDLDIQLPFSTPNNNLQLKLRDFSKGNWTLKLKFNHAKTDYYLEEKLDL
jgi:FixH